MHRCEVTAHLFLGHGTGKLTRELHAHLRRRDQPDNAALQFPLITPMPETIDHKGVIVRLAQKHTLEKTMTINALHLFISSF